MSPRMAADHLRHRRRRRVVGGAGLEQGHDLGAAVAGAVDERLDPLGRQQLRERDAGDRAVARQRHHRVAVAAEHEGVRAADGDAELPGDEGPEARRVEHAGHADDALAREAAGLHGHVAHRVERVGDDDQDRVGRDRRGLADDRADDARVLGQQVVAAHARLAGQAGGDDDDVGAGRVGVVVGARDRAVVAHDRRRLGQVERLALGQPLDDVDQDDVGQASLGDALGGGRADVAGADDGDLGTGHERSAPSGARWMRTVRTPF